MKITMYELLGMIKEGKASDIATNFMFDRKKYNLLGFLDEYTLDINSLNWEIEIIEEEKKIPEKLEYYDDSIAWVIDGIGQLSDVDKVIVDKLNEVLDYLKSKGE